MCRYKQRHTKIKQKIGLFHFNQESHSLGTETLIKIKLLKGTFDVKILKYVP